MQSNIHRAMTAKELDLLGKLLSEDFPGRNELQSQLSAARLTQLDENGSFRLDVDIASRALVTGRIPVEAEYVDQDGVVVHILLHVVDGILHELEIYKDDSSRVMTSPNEAQISVWVKK